MNRRSFAAVLILGGFLPAVAHAQSCPTTFAGARVYDRGLTLRLATAAGDFDGDQRMDIASLRVNSDAASTPQAVTVLLNRGNYAFDPQPVTAQGAFETLAAADLNNDSLSDLVLGGTSPLTVLIASGGGSFRKANADAITNVRGIALADFNGDGRRDIATVQSFPAAVTVLLGTAAGEYRTAGSYPLATAGTSIAAGDLDGDGRADFVAGDQSLATPYWGGGNGSFTRGTSISGAYPRSLAIGDLNRDGRPDLVIGSEVYITVHMNAGPRELRFGRSYESGVAAETTVLGDITGDSLVDAIVIGSGTVAVLPGDGAAGFGSSVLYGAGGTTGRGAVADFDGDGKLDVVVPHRETGSISVLTNAGGGRLDAPERLPITGSVAAVLVTDTDLDGITDIVAAAGNNLVILPRRSGGTFATAFVVGTGFAIASLASGDFNGDHRVDFAALSEDGRAVAIIFGGPFGPSYGESVPFAESLCCIQAADVNADGRSDLIVAERRGNVGIALRQASGFAAPAFVAAGTEISDMVVADFNRDGVADAAVLANLGTSVVIFTGAASGALTQVKTLAVSGGQTLATANLRSDYPDLIVGGRGTDIFFNDATFAFSSQLHFSLPETVDSLHVADVDRNGFPDVIASGYSAETSEYEIATLYSRGNGSFETALVQHPDAPALSPATIDINGDGLLDLLYTVNGQLLLARGRCEVPRVVLGTPVTGYLGGTVPLVANVVAGGGRAPLTFLFREGDRVIASATSTTSQPGFARATATLSPGAHTITVMVQSSTGVVGISRPVTIFVGPARHRAVRF